MPWDSIWKVLFPPDRKVSPSSFLTIFAFWLFAAWSLGMVPAFGSGFASATDMKQIQTSLLEASILDLRIRYCSAPDGTDVKRYFFSQTQSKTREYKDATGSDFRLPPCKDLVYDAKADTGE